MNVDQVPLPFVNDMEVTYAERGSTRVNINQLGPAFSKRQATGQLCFRPMVPPKAGCTTSEATALYNKYLEEHPRPALSSAAKVMYPLTKLLHIPTASLCYGRRRRGSIVRSRWSGSRTS